MMSILHKSSYLIHRERKAESIPRCHFDSGESREPIEADGGPATASPSSTTTSSSSSSTVFPPLSFDAADGARVEDELGEESVEFVVLNQGVFVQAHHLVGKSQLLLNGVEGKGDVKIEEEGHTPI